MIENPASNREMMAYLAGVVSGDGWCSAKTVGLKAKDRDFVEAFSFCLGAVFGCDAMVRPDAGRYWKVVSMNSSGRYNSILLFKPKTRSEKGFWVRGLFDGDGSAIICRMKGAVKSRRVIIVKTTPSILETAKLLLGDIGITAYMGPRSNGTGHFGTKQVYGLTITASKQNYEAFQERVGTSICRKRIKIDEIISSYSDQSVYTREGQRKGAAAKRNKIMTVVLPAVLRGINKARLDGSDMSMRSLTMIIPKYNTILSYFKHSALADMSKSVAE